MNNIPMTIFLGVALLMFPKLALSEQITHTIRCESQHFAPRHCELPAAPHNAEIQEIRKVNQLSSKPCIEGRSWVANESAITVRDGCRADFLVVYRVSNYSERRERSYGDQDWHQRQERSEDWHANSPPQYEENPNELVVRSFEDILNRRPSKEEMRFYRHLIVDRGWTERQIRRELRNRRHSGGHR